MSTDDFQEAWQKQTPPARLTIDADLILNEVQRNQRYFTAMIFGRDLREIGVSLLMVPLWLYLGSLLALPWTWYLTVPALLWIAGYMLVNRIHHNRQRPQPGDPLRRRVECSLAQVEHQIGLLRSVHWWYLLPIALAILAFFAQCAWQQRSRGWAMALPLSGTLVIVAVVFGFVYWLNQFAVRSELEPRRRELESLLASLKDEVPDLG